MVEVRMHVQGRDIDEEEEMEMCCLGIASLAK